MKSGKYISTEEIVRLIEDKKVSVAELKAALDGLTELDLSSQKLTDADIKKLLEAITDNITLQWLDLHDNQIGAAGAEAIGKGLEKNNMLQSLDLKSNNIGAAGAEAIGKGLEKNSTLQSLFLGLNNIKDAGAEALGKVLEQNSTLQSLSLDSNSIGAAGAEALGKVLEQNSTLQSLDLWLNWINDAGAKAIGKALEKNNTLQSLNLYGNNIEDAGVEVIGKALEQNNTLQSLDLRNNKIRAAGVEVIGKALEQNSTLQLLDLRWNQIGDVGARFLAKGLENNSALQSLDLGNNNVGYTGVEALGKALEQNSMLQSLDLRENNIRAAGAEAIGKALEQNSTLQSLNLQWNNIRAAGAEAIGKALEQNNTLQSLNLHMNNIGDAGAEAIGKALEQNSMLQLLFLGSNKIGAAGAEALGKVLEQNSTLQSLNLQWNNIRAAGGGAKINDLISINNEKRNTLFDAIKTGDINTVENYLKQGLSANLIDENGKSSLHMAIANEELIALLLKYDAYPLIKDQKGLTALELAKGEGVKQSIIRMLENAEDKQILAWCRKKLIQGTIDAQQALQKIKKMTDIKYITNLYADYEGNTILHAAASNEDEEMIRVFIHRGFYINVKNKGGETPLSLVEKSNNKALLEKINLWLKEARIAKKEKQFQQLIAEQSKQKAKEIDFASERKALYENVKELTEDNPFIAAVQDLWTLKRQKQALLSAEAERCLTELIFNHLDPPQILLRHAGYTSAEKLSLKLKNRNINPKHPMFSNLQKTLKSIEKTIYALSNEKVEVEGIFKKLEEVSNLYEHYLRKVCSAKDEDERKELYKIPSILRGAGMEPRQLSEEGAPLSIKTMHGEKINEYGTAAVKIINGVHFKENPHAPGVEFMVSSLSNALAGRGATPTELIKVINDKGQSINYLASKTIRGTELHDLIERHPDLINKISCRNFSEIMVLGLLINPQDGKPDNYMVEVQNVENGEIESLRIIGIDNDIAFADPVVLEHTGEKKGQHFVNVKNVIYLMPQMKKRFVKEFTSVFLQQSPEFVMIEWLKGLKEKNKEYQALLEEGVFIEKEFMGDGITSKLGLQLPIRLVPKTAATLYNKLKKIHHYLETQPNITHEELFMKIQPILARYYRGIIQEVKGDVMEGIKLLYKQNAPTIEEEINLESQITSNNTHVMTELVLRTAERYGFEEKRVQTIDDSIREFIYAVDYSQYDKESTELLYQQYDGFGEIGLDYRNAKSFFVSAVQEKQCSETLLEHLFENADLDITVRLERSDDITLKGDESLLHLAVQYNQVKVVESLIKRGVEVNAINVDGRTALHIAASTGNVEVIKCLIDSGAELNIKDELTSHTVLDKALSKNKEEAAKLLLQKGGISGSNKYDGIIERLSKELAAKGEAPKQGNSGKTLSKVNTDFVSKLNAAIETQAGLSP